ncbi:MAG: hypothetical protein ACR2JO_09710 [Mycobacteriales bacterium]
MTVPDLRRRRAARILTETGAPVVVLVVMPLVIALHSADTVAAGLGRGLLAAVFFGVIPFGYVLRGVRLGRWNDHHVGDRAQRKPVFLFSLASMLTGVAVLVLLGAPRDLVAFLVTLLAEAALALAVTLGWKISLHTWVSTIGATALVVVYGWLALVLWPVLAGIGWSRVELRDHTPAQVIAGALMGIASTAIIYPVLR